MDNEMKLYVKERLLSEPPAACRFKVSDVVTYTNSYGVVFEGLKIIGFSGEEGARFKRGKFIHLDKGSYWMPVAAVSLNFKGEEK